MPRTPTSYYTSLGAWDTMSAGGRRAVCGYGITVAGKVLLWYGILLRYPATVYVYVCSYSGKVLMFPAWPLNIAAEAP